MSQRNWKEFIKNTKSKYRKIGQIQSPAFFNEKVSFNHYGFKHLFYKDRKFRIKPDVKRRLFLLPHAIRILKYKKEIYHQEESVKEKSIAHFWEIREEKYIGSKKKIIRIVLRKLNNGTLHFLSVYDK